MTLFGYRRQHVRSQLLIDDECSRDNKYGEKIPLAAGKMEIWGRFVVIRNVKTEFATYLALAGALIAMA